MVPGPFDEGFGHAGYVVDTKIPHTISSSLAFNGKPRVSYRLSLIILRFLTSWMGMREYFDYELFPVAMIPLPFAVVKAWISRPLMSRTAEFSVAPNLFPSFTINKNDGL